MQRQKRFPSIADDTGTAERNGIHSLRLVLNNVAGAVEVPSILAELTLMGAPDEHSSCHGMYFFVNRAHRAQFAKQRRANRARGDGGGDGGVDGGDTDDDDSNDDNRAGGGGGGGGGGGDGGADRGSDVGGGGGAHSDDATAVPMTTLWSQAACTTLSSQDVVALARPPRTWSIAPDSS
jgi:hypothetical protein